MQRTNLDEVAKDKRGTKPELGNRPVKLYSAPSSLTSDPSTIQAISLATTMAGGQFEWFWWIHRQFPAQEHLGRR